jgi:16S rRNA (guanine(966)-N(2))-methyltransferase RsmD
MAKLRVIGGEAKGRKLRMVPGGGTRPISDRVKEALFNILAGKVVGSRWLDLFAGTGSVGIEALSRGASMVTFTDRNPAAISTIRSNLRHTQLDDRAAVIKKDAFTFLSKSKADPYDFVFIAPPQYLGLWKKAILLLDQMSDWIRSEGRVIIQIHPKEYEQLELSELFEIDQRKYGNTMLVFFERTDTRST